MFVTEVPILDPIIIGIAVLNIGIAVLNISIAVLNIGIGYSSTKQRYINTSIL